MSPTPTPLDAFVAHVLARRAANEARRLDAERAASMFRETRPGSLAESILKLQPIQWPPQRDA